MKSRATHKTHLMTCGLGNAPASHGNGMTSRARAWRVWGSFALAAWFVPAAAAARDVEPASPVRVQLDFERAASAASCVTAEQLVHDVEGRLGRRVFVAAAEADLVARVSARRDEGRFLLEIELLDRAGQRLGLRQLSSRAAHCSSLDDSLALVLALAVDAARAAVETPPSPTPAAPPAIVAPPAPLETPLLIPARTHAPRLGWGWAPSVGVALASGLFPSAALGLELGLELRPPHFWPLTLRGTWWLEQDAAGPRPGRRVAFAARTLELGVCPWTGPIGAFEAAACLVQWLGRLDARGFGFDESGSDDGWLAAIGVAPALGYRIGPLKASLAPTLLVPLLQRRYFSTDATDITLHEQPGVFWAGTLRVSAEF